jgi:hypothetical protein
MQKALLSQSHDLQTRTVIEEFGLLRYVLGIIRIPQRAEHLSHTWDPQFRQWKDPHFGVNGPEQQTHRVAPVIIFGGEYTFANFRASLSELKGKLTHRRFSSRWEAYPSTGRAKVAIQFEVATLK